MASTVARFRSQTRKGVCVSVFQNEIEGQIKWGVTFDVQWFNKVRKTYVPKKTLYREEFEEILREGLKALSWICEVDGKPFPPDLLVPFLTTTETGEEYEEDYTHPRSAGGGAPGAELLDVEHLSRIVEVDDDEEY